MTSHSEPKLTAGPFAVDSKYVYRVHVIGHETDRPTNIVVHLAAESDANVLSLISRSAERNGLRLVPEDPAAA